MLMFFSDVFLFMLIVGEDIYLIFRLAIEITSDFIAYLLIFHSDISCSHYFTWFAWSHTRLEHWSIYIYIDVSIDN